MGVGINVTPLVIYKVLGLGELKPIFARLLMANSSINKLVGIIQNVEVKVSSFTYPTYFMILDYEVDSHSPIILVRPFLSTSGMSIDMDLEGITFK